MNESIKSLIIRKLPILTNLVEDFKHYQIVKIDLERIVYFLTQFESDEQVDIVIRLMEKIDFLNSKKFTFLLKKAYDQIAEDLLVTPVFCPLGGSHDSSSMICYPLLKELFDNEKETLNQVTTIDALGSTIRKQSPSVIVFFDDNITSGTQLSQFFKELILGDNDPELVRTPLSKDEYNLLKKLPIRICYAIQLDLKSKEVLNKLRSDYDLNIEICVGKFDFNNYLDFQTSNIKSEAESVFAKNFIEKIAKELYIDKDWTKDTIYQRLLGYGNLGKVTVFYYNVPKSLIPIFWKTGIYKGKQWIPLFPETQEQKKIEKNNVVFDFYQLEAIKGWLVNGLDARKPNILFGIRTDSLPSQEIVLKVLSKKYIDNLMGMHFAYKSIEPEANNAMLNREDYGRYVEAINEFRLEYEKYCSDVKNYLYVLSTRNRLPFEIINNGKIAATDFTVKVK
ncbi:MAG TPA: hypothetical protein VLB84_20165 [Bacteroidia bacterium]|nr:hypothetical protein [Bacteroidia bacterium]